ncbi:MAG TPA: Gfo/Idh/MocA family oxidoreductase [Armatimonadota bacterium]|jgi:predicted dehydrogenase
MKVGIIGAGGIAGEHKRGYDRLEDVELAGVADVSPASREKATNVWKTSAYETVTELLNTAKPDAVSICTPPKFHADVAVQCLERGVAVLCEKPMAFNVEDAERIAAAAGKASVPFMVAFCHRYHPPVIKVKEAIDAGKLGAVMMYRNRFGGKQDMSKTWFGDPAVAGGGTLMDTSVHSIDLFRFLVGDAAWITGAVANIAGIHRVEDSCIVTFGTASGAYGVIEGSWSSPGSANIIEVYGTEGAATVNYNNGEAQLLLKGSGAWEKIETDGPDRFEREVEAFINAVKTKTAAPITVKDGLAANRIIAAAYKSSSEGIRVNL